MSTPAPGLRDRKKARTREQIADAAARLFAARGYDAVSMAEVARAADVSDQTVYNYFPAKQDLVLDRAEQFRERYRAAVAGRGTSSPARALAPLLVEDVERYRASDLDEAAGEFLAQSVASNVLRRFTLEERERQAKVVAEALAATSPALPPAVAQVHAASVVAAVQHLHDRIGRHVLDRSSQQPAADELLEVVDQVVSSLDRAFRHLT